MTDDAIAAVRGRMEQFLEAVEACVEALPALVGYYRRGEAASRERVADYLSRPRRRRHGMAADTLDVVRRTPI